jgi:hypothetical protein
MIGGLIDDSSLESVDGRANEEKHRCRIAVQDTFADPGQGDKAEGLVAGDRVGLGVRDHAEAADAVALIDGEGQDVAQESFTYSLALHPRVDAEASEAEDGQWIGGKALA